MFVKHIDERNFLDAGFVVNPVTKETFSKKSVDIDTISTYVQVWNDMNIYKFKAVTDIEGTVELGAIRNMDDLNEIERKYFKDQKREFLFRQLIPLVDEKIELDNIQITLLYCIIDSADDETLDELIQLNFGDKNEKA